MKWQTHRISVSARRTVAVLKGLAAADAATRAALGMLQVCRAVKPAATVLLTGDGGDDVYLGYPEHKHLYQASQLARWLPPGTGWSGPASHAAHSLAQARVPSGLLQQHPDRRAHERVAAEEDRDGCGRRGGGERPKPWVRDRIGAQEVMLATERPRNISALNVLSGTIAELRVGTGPGALVALQCGEARLLARITQRSLNALGLAVGQKCYAVIKSVAIAKHDVGAAIPREGVD